MKDQTIAEFGSADFDAQDEATMIVRVGGKPTDWTWIFAGPGHEKTVAQSNRLGRERLAEDAAKEQARVNGKKWKAPDETIDEVRARNIKWVTERLIGWSPVKIDGEAVVFSEDAARRLLSDPRKSDLLVQAIDFLTADASFTKRSATP